MLNPFFILNNIPARSKRAGFTLIELIVSIAIFGTIATLVVANLRGGTQRSELTLGATTVAEAIREAVTRTNAGELASMCVGGVMNGKVCPGTGCGPGSNCVNTLPLGGFGVHMVQNSTDYIVFADLNNNLAYDAGEEVRTGKIINTGTVSVSGFSTGGASLSISFRPPKPTGYINGATTESFANILLRHRFLSETRTVHFERVSASVGLQ